MHWIVPALDHGGPQRIRTYHSNSDQNAQSTSCSITMPLCVKGEFLWFGERGGLARAALPGWS